MKTRTARCGAALLVLMILLAACASLPQEAKQAALDPFDPDERPRIHFALRVDPLPEDQEMGADEVWCVRVAFRCWSPSCGRWYTCVSSYLVRRADGEWQTDEIATREDWERWEARGCPRDPDVVQQFPRRQNVLASAAEADLMEPMGTSRR
jgi:hypothetical protein